MLSAEQIFILGALATALTFILRLLATYVGINLGRIGVNVLLFVVSVLFAVVWSDFQLPPFSGNPVEFLAAIVQMVTPLVGMASLIYNVLYEKVVVPITAKYFA